MEQKANEQIVEEPVACVECGERMRHDRVDQEFEREGLRVLVGGIPAWKCPRCGEVSFDPGTMDHVVRSARELFEVARMRPSGGANVRAIAS